MRQIGPNKSSESGSTLSLEAPLLELLQLPEGELTNERLEEALVLLRSLRSNPAVLRKLLAPQKQKRKEVDIDDLLT